MLKLWQAGAFIYKSDEFSFVPLKTNKQTNTRCYRKESDLFVYVVNIAVPYEPERGVALIICI